MYMLLIIPKKDLQVKSPKHFDSIDRYIHYLKLTIDLKLKLNYYNQVKKQN